MLINNVSTERRSSLIVKNSAFYIEIAKFVQAYTTIVKNPNEFLAEINREPINEKTDHLVWEQLVEIMQKCDFGFAEPPTRMDLVVYYNYALEMGSVDALEKKIATVNEVAEAQKHYYNFVDDAKDKAEEAYQKQKKIFESRQREVDYVRKNLSKIRAKNWVSSIFMFFAILFGILGGVGFFVDNAITEFIGNLIPIGKPNFVGGIVLIAVMIVVFLFCNKVFVKTKRDYVKLWTASEIIFVRVDETFAMEQVLKKKLDELKNDYAIVQREINDKNKKYDVKHNIEELKASNKYYQKYCEVEEEFDVQKEAVSSADGEAEFAPIKLTKEQEENVRTVASQIINLEGQFDTEAYNEKFEKTEKESSDQKVEEKEEKTEENVVESVDYIKDILGMANQNNQSNLSNPEKD